MNSLSFRSSQLAKLLLPLVIIPITLYSVISFNQVAGDVIIGLAFFTGFMLFTKNKNEKKFMIVLSVFAMLFETANVAIGIYKYINVVQIPIWVAIGWGVLGIYILRNLDLLKQISDKHTHLISAILFLFIWAVYGFELVGPRSLVVSVLAIASVFVLSKSSEQPASLFFFTAFMGVLIEFLGTSFGVWTYYFVSGTGTAVPIPPPLAGLGMAYASVLAFCLWISKLD